MTSLIDVYHGTGYSEHHKTIETGVMPLCGIIYTGDDSISGNLTTDRQMARTAAILKKISGQQPVIFHYQIPDHVLTDHGLLPSYNARAFSTTFHLKPPQVPRPYLNALYLTAEDLAASGDRIVYQVPYDYFVNVIRVGD